MLRLQMSPNVKYHLLFDIQDVSLKNCSCLPYKTIGKLFFYREVQLEGSQFFL